MEYQLTAPSDHQYYSTATNYVTKKSPQPMEFPTSPQLIFGEEIIHFSHPQHPLSMMDIKDLFICVGCKEYGSGKRFVCQQCDYQLHDFCALAPPALKAHPFHSQHSMLFHSKPAKSGMAKSKCDVCGKPTKGFAFLCTACAFQMHPCCAMLNTEIEYPNHPHTLKIMPSTSTNPSSNYTDSGGGSIVCGECKKKRSGKVYRCTVCDYHLHAVCAKSKVNGLQANGIKPPEKPSVLAAAAKVKWGRKDGSGKK
ncbi:Zinc finger, PHD-type, conserved site [Sesbania bispinosa]|nr:Zinc finger, PHD-type, conserved site [Sesbania bispinosa]